MFLYKSKPFSLDEREDLKLIIQSNIYNYLGILLEGRERFDDEASANRKINPSDPSSSGTIYESRLLEFREALHCLIFVKQCSTRNILN
jgi:hypothetical protein